MQVQYKQDESVRLLLLTIRLTGRQVVMLETEVRSIRWMSGSEKARERIL